MFAKHQKKIMRFAMKNSDNLFWVVLMVSLSIRQPWALIGKQLEDVRQNGYKAMLYGEVRKTCMSICLRTNKNCLNC